MPTATSSGRPTTTPTATPGNDSGRSDGSGSGTIADVQLNPYNPMPDPAHFAVDYSAPIETGPMGFSFKNWSIQDLAMVIGKDESISISEASDHYTFTIPDDAIIL